MRKIWSSHGLRGIYKGQVATLWREASGYGVYFWAYERLVKRELANTGGRREDISPAKAVLFGAGAGYAVRSHPRGVLECSFDMNYSCGRSSIPLT